MPCANSDEFNQDLKTAMVSFKGSFSGCLLLSVSTALLPLLSSNMMGEDSGNPQLLENDALCEIANIICGNVLPAIYGFKQVFHLDAPTLLDPSQISNVESSFKEVSRSHIGFDSGAAVVALFVDSSASIAD
jgi:chemotaxis protein CheY-P-specific phosphatase CheC